MLNSSCTLYYLYYYTLHSPYPFYAALYIPTIHDHKSEPHHLAIPYRITARVDECSWSVVVLLPVLVLQSNT